MATIRAGILNSQKKPEPIDPDLKIYGVDGLPTKSEHMPNLNVVRTDDAVGMTPADFHNVFPFNEIINENVPNFVEYGRWDANYNTFDSQSHMVSELSKSSRSGTGVFYEHLFGAGIAEEKQAHAFYGTATHCKIYVKDPNNRYKYVLASGTKYGKDIAFENCFYEMENMDDYFQELKDAGVLDLALHPDYAYPVVKYGFLFIIIPMTGVTGYIYHNGTEWVKTKEAISMTDSYVQAMDKITPKQEITTSSTFKTLNDNKYWRYNGGTSYTIADFDEIPIPLTPTKRIPKFYVKRGMNPDGTWYEKISKTKHDETWLCHKAFISDGLEKPYLYVASEIVTSTYRDLREDRGNFKVYGETEYDMFETLFRIAYGSWMSTYDEDDIYVIADLKEFGIEYLDCVLRVDTKYDASLGTTLDGVGFSRPFGIHNDMAMRVSEISTFRNAKGEGASYLNVTDDAPVDGAMYHFNEIEINGNDIFKYVSIVSEHDDPNPVIKQSIDFDMSSDTDWMHSYQALANDTYVESFRGEPILFRDETFLFDIPLTLAAPNQEMGGMTIDLYVGTNGQLQALYDACVNETIQYRDTYYVNNVATYYEGDVSGLIDFPIPIYSFANDGGNEDASFLIGDLTPLGLGLGLVLAKIVDVTIPNNNIVITQGSERPLTLRDVEYYMRSGKLWKLIYQLTEIPFFLRKKDQFNPTVMDLQTYTKTNNKYWPYGYNGNQQPNTVGIGTGMGSFSTYIKILLFFIADNLEAIQPLLMMKFLNADHFAYEVLLHPVKTRLVMLP